MTTKKKKKAKQSSPGRSASTSPSSSTQTSGDNKQQIAQSTASSSPVNCDLAAADIAGSDTNPFSDLLLEHNATGQIENGAIDLDLMDNDEIPLTFTKEFVGITQETSTNQSALPAVVVNPELQDIGAAAPSSAKSIVAVSSETTTPKSVLPTVVANPESQDLGDAAPSSAKPTVVISSETTTPKSALPAAVVNPESQVQGDTTPKTTEKKGKTGNYPSFTADQKGKEIDHHPLPAGKPWVVLGDFNQVLRPSENSAAVCPNIDLPTRLFADSLSQSGLGDFVSTTHLLSDGSPSDGSPPEASPPDSGSLDGSLEGSLAVLSTVLSADLLTVLSTVLLSHQHRIPRFEGETVGVPPPYDLHTRVINFVQKDIGEMFPKWEFDVEDTPTENIIKLIFVKRPWKWTMDCWEVTGTWVNTKPTVVSPAKKKVVKEDSPRPQKKARKEAHAEASEEAPAEASEEVHTVARSEVTTTVGGLTKEDIKTMFKDIVDAMREGHYRTPLDKKSRTSRTWWYHILRTSLEWLEDCHIDAWINVLRKRYDANPQYFMSERMCFLDHLFAQQWRFNYKDFKDSVPDQNGLGRRLLGGAWNYYAGTIPSFFQSNKVWGTNIDDVYAPVNYTDSHWIAMWISIPKRHIVVWDSICSSISPEKLDVVMEPFLYMVRYLLVECAYSDEQRAQYSLEPLTYERLTNIPQARADDCRVYALKYIECHALGMPFSKKDFAKPNGKTMRDKMAVDIFKELPDAHEFENKDNDANLGAYEG
ncbi:hypothetical protein DY000_02012343 [Brassica cretica]|uniref:Ubiquitin-like protease family profile domain-containing protein n=1 Tax=Brassica cretica TaxID=69181 RepID=A0ABQ7CZX8_BRACR|nr:hypothetical protein DY000_02012343 [Brassica cretica]